MENKSIKVATARQIQTGTGLILVDGVWLFVSLLFFLAVLGWATWTMRLVSPLAFALFAALMGSVLVLAIVDVWYRLAGSASAPSMKTESDSVCLTEQIKRSRPIRDVPLIIL